MKIKIYKMHCTAKGKEVRPGGFKYCILGCKQIVKKCDTDSI